ncbi:MAG: hypothetical protein H7Z14_10075 [Anaerolineae bacterium]|nr:hypothetical protein [Phycisphaerae bacterium]
MMLFLGSGKKAVGSELPVTATPPYNNPEMFQTGIGNNPTPQSGAPTVTGAVGAVKLSTVPKPAKAIINGDSVNYFINVMYEGGLGVWTWWQPQVHAGLPKQTLFDSGSPNRHGGNGFDVGAIKPVTGRYGNYTGNGNINTGQGFRKASGRPGTCFANYLFLDGHAETLTSDVALRALVTRNW